MYTCNEKTRMVLSGHEPVVEAESDVTWNLSVYGQYILYISLHHYQSYT